MMRVPPRSWCCAAWLAGALGCVGSVGAPSDDSAKAGPSTPGPSKPGPSTTPPPAGACGSGGVAPLRRLTRAEYNATVRDLLGFDTQIAAGFVPDEKVGPFDANISSPVSETALDDYLKAADQLARRVVSEPKLLAAVLPCEPKTGSEAACGKTFVETFGLRAYRRPLTAAEVTRLVGVFMTGVGQGDATLGVRLVVQTMLSSPNFLYHLELGAPDASGSVRALTPYELASRLSYYLWGSMPDGALLEAARSGDLTKPQTLEAQARRLLADDRARLTLRSFHTQWLGVTKLLDPDQFDHPIGPSAYEEIVRAVDDTLWAGDGKLPSLFTTRTAWVNAALWSLYGLPGTAPSGFQKVELDPKQRSGLLTRAAVLAAHRTPTARGKFVRSEVLCQNVPAPPPNVDTALPPADPTQPPRARWEKHVADPSCGNCHRLMDPIGFGFDHYDGVGKYRTKDGTWPVDATGEVVGTSGSDGPFTGAVELSERLAKADELGRCVAHEMFVFAFGRAVDPAQDACALDAAEKAFRASGLDIKTLMLAVAQSDGFRARRIAP